MRDKLLFTPGPLTCSRSVKEAMLSDLGSRDFKFINIVKRVRNELLKLGNVSQEKGYEALLMQGSGTFGLESVISSVIPSDGHLLLVVNGAYGQRLGKIAEVHGIKTTIFEYAEDELPATEDADKLLLEDRTITHLAVVHCETSTGMFNPIADYGRIAKTYKTQFIVDAMSSFGGVALDIAACNIDFMISSSNKCIEGVPGFSTIIARRSALEKAEGNARSLSLDLYAQWKGLESNGQFRFTPPTHSILAFNQALMELEEEGGVEGRAARYKENYQTLINGMRKMGFTEYLPPILQGYIITSFHYPKDPNFDFKVFYEKLNDAGFVIYPGKLSKVDCFRIGNIGRLYKKDILDLIWQIEIALGEMGVKLPLPSN